MASDAAYEGDFARMILCLNGASSSSPVDLAEVMLNAVASGSMQCVRYLCQNKFPWHRNTTASAAYHGDQAMLEFSHRNGALWHKCTTVRAVERGHLGCFKYAEENGAPHNVRLLLTCLQGVHRSPVSKAHWDILLYAVNAGYTYRPSLGLKDEDDMTFHERMQREEDELWDARDAESTSMRRATTSGEDQSAGWSVDCNEDQMDRSERAFRRADVAFQIENELGTLEAASRELHHIRLIQRAWRLRSGQGKARQTKARVNQD